MMKLRKSEKTLIKHLPALRIVCTMIALLGLAGIPLGLYVHFFRKLSPCARALNLSLTAYSVGVFILGCLLTHAYSMILKLLKERDSKDSL